MSIIIKMYDIDVEHAISSGKLRTKIKLNSEDTENYKAGKRNGFLISDDDANPRANISETAIGYLTDQVPGRTVYPNELHWYFKNKADVGDNTEVRTVRTRKDISITAKDKGRIVYGCAVSDDLKEVEVFGWINADDAMQPKYWVEEFYPDGSLYRGWRVPLTDLTPPPPLPRYYAVRFE